jgi:acetyl esterase
LLFHSGGWTKGRPEWLFGLAKQFSSFGLVAIPVRYRLSKGGITPIDAMADACAAFRWVREHATELGIDPKRVAGWGASAGGQLIASGATVGCAGESATSGSADALVLVSAGVDVQTSQQFRKLVGEGTDVKPYSALAHVAAGVPPTLLVAGAEDSVTTLETAERFCKRITEVGGSCELRAFPGLGHLLTRDLEDQRTRLNPDPGAEGEAHRAQVQFLRKIGFISPDAGEARAR